MSGRNPQEGWEFNPLTHARRVVLDFLQGLFSLMPEGSFKWSSDDKLTEIVITAASPVDLSAPEKRPVITCVRGPAQFGQMFMDDFQSGNWLTSTDRHADMLSTTLAINCISNAELEAEELAWITARHMWILRKILIQRGFHEFGRGIRIDSPTPAGALVQGTGSGDDWRKVSIFVPAFFRYSDYITPSNLKKMQGVITKITADSIKKVTGDPLEQVAET